MALVDKTTLKGYFNTGDRPNEDTFVDVFDSVLSLHGNDNQTVAGNTTFSGDATFTGDFNINNDTPNVAGAGVSSAGGNSWSINIQNNIVTSVGELDIDGLSSAGCGDTNAIGNAGAAASAYFTKLSTGDNGYIFYAGITCVQAPTGGAVDIDLVFDTTDSAQTAVVSDVVIPTGADWTIGMSRNSNITDTVLTGGLKNYFVYLRVGDSGENTAEYTAGKFIIVLQGHKAF